MFRHSFGYAGISIHAPRAGSDARCICRIYTLRRISIHAPRAGSDNIPVLSALEHGNFNPRSPCGERRHNGGMQILPVHISIHAPRAGSDRGRGHPLPDTGISIHAPRAGSDNPPPPQASRKNRFQSTLPVRGATEPNLFETLYSAISIHAPRAGSDNNTETPANRDNYFNPRSPCGERPTRAITSSSR